MLLLAASECIYRRLRGAAVTVIEVLGRKGADYLSQANSSIRKALFRTPSNQPFRGVSLSATFFDVHLLRGFILCLSLLMWWLRVLCDRHWTVVRMSVSSRSRGKTESL